MCGRLRSFAGRCCRCLFCCCRRRGANDDADVEGWEATMTALRTDLKLARESRVITSSWRFSFLVASLLYTAWLAAACSVAFKLHKQLVMDWMPYSLLVLVPEVRHQHNHPSHCRLTCVRRVWLAPPLQVLLVLLYWFCGKMIRRKDALVEKLEAEKEEHVRKLRVRDPAWCRHALRLVPVVGWH